MRNVRGIEDLIESKNKHPNKILGLYGCDRFSEYIIDSVKRFYNDKIIYIRKDDINNVDNNLIHLEYVGDLRVRDVFWNLDKGFKVKLQ